jgi:Fe2+ or Zn2+ uptake regulation protein
MGTVSKPLALPDLGPAEVSTVEDVLALVRARGGRATSSRRILLEVFFDAEGHQSAEELAEAVQARAPDVHISTIYRNLEDLQHLGVIVHSHLGHGPAIYQLASLAHAHLVCEECGTRIEAPDDLFKSLTSAAKAKFGFAVNLNRPGIPGGSVPWKRGWSHGIIWEADAASVHAGAEGAGGSSGPPASSGDWSEAWCGAACCGAARLRGGVGARLGGAGRY